MSFVAILSRNCIFKYTNKNEVGRVIMRLGSGLKHFRKFSHLPSLLALLPLDSYYCTWYDKTLLISDWFWIIVFSPCHKENQMKQWRKECHLKRYIFQSLAFWWQSCGIYSCWVPNINWLFFCPFCSLCLQYHNASAFRFTTHH